MFGGIKQKIKEREQYKNLRMAQQRFLQAGQVIDAIDARFKAQNVPREKRRQFWHGFVFDKDFRMKFARDMIEKNEKG